MNDVQVGFYGIAHDPAWVIANRKRPGKSWTWFHGCGRIRPGMIEFIELIVGCIIGMGAWVLRIWNMIWRWIAVNDKSKDIIHSGKIVEKSAVVVHSYSNKP